MKLFPCLHDRYVARAVVATVLLTWLVLLGLDVVNGFASEVRDIGKGSYSFGHAIAYIAYTVPRRAYTLFPTAAVIGMLLGLGQLAATSELTALRALGVSRTRLSLSVMMMIGMGTGLMVLTGETLGPWAQAQADILKASAKYKSDMTGARYSGFWAREGEVFLNARSGEEKRLDSGGIMLILHDVRLYQLAADGRLQSMTRAARVDIIRMFGYFSRCNGIRSVNVGCSVRPSTVCLGDHGLIRRCLRRVWRSHVICLRTSLCKALSTGAVITWMRAISRGSTGVAGFTRSMCWRCVWQRFRFLSVCYVVAVWVSGRS